MHGKSVPSSASVTECVLILKKNLFLLFSNNFAMKLFLIVKLKYGNYDQFKTLIILIYFCEIWLFYNGVIYVSRQYLALELFFTLFYQNTLLVFKTIKSLAVLLPYFVNAILASMQFLQ